MAINIRTYNEILGDIIRKIIAETSLNDVNSGSVLLTLAEACATVDFENNSSILNILELLNIDVIRDSDLDSRAADYGLSRKVAQKASGFISITDSTISKRSTGFYQVKPAPIAGQQAIYVNNAEGWNTSHKIYIGRGTPNFEGPIGISSIVNNGSYYTINLSSALQRDHLISDVVVDSQGKSDRFIAAGTICKIPASSQNPEVKYIVLRDAILPAGEDTLENVAVVAEVGGKNSNAGINTITQFQNTPFTGATCTNTTAFTNGSDIESDDELRERIKSYSSTLARGTQASILAAVIGVSDSDDGKQVASAYITEPPLIGDPSILYIDDGTGFQPSTSGQSVDVLLSDASGNEEFLQLANYPLPRPEVTNAADGPYVLADGMTLKVLVDGVEETITFNTDDFVNITAASLAEVIVAINNQSELFKARFTENSSRILMYPTSHSSETIQVVAITDEEDPDYHANLIFKFPTNEFSYIRLYKDSTLLTEKSSAASLTTNSFSTWNITASGNIIISVDGTPAQNQTFTTTDFNGTAFAALTISDWVTAFNNKFAGITVIATSSDQLQITSNKIGADSSLQILGGTYQDNWFANVDTTAEGTQSDFQLNRQNGNLRILADIDEGDTITAGTSDARGNYVSTASSSGTYAVSTDGENRDAVMVLGVDSDETVSRSITVTAGDTITVQDMGGGVTRLLSTAATTFGRAQPGDFIYITSRGGIGTTLVDWIHPDNCGLHKITAKGDHTNLNTDTWIEYKQASFGGTDGTEHVIEASEDLQIFKSDEYPQIWRGSFLATPAAATVQEVVDSMNDSLANVNASVYKTSSIKISSSTEDDGSIALPVSVASATNVYPTRQERQTGNPSHIAYQVPSKDAFTFFKRTTPTDVAAGGTANREVWLDRHTYGDYNALISAAAVPSSTYTSGYSEQISSNVFDSDIVNPDDIIMFQAGNNKRHYRSIREIQAANFVGTQHAKPRSILDHVTSDKLGLVRPLQLHPNDSVVMILDQDAVAKTIDIPLSRSGIVNTDTSVTASVFSATDLDGEEGVGFDDTQVWGTATNNTDFKDYAVWMQARNWYMTGGAYPGNNALATTSGTMIIRSAEYGPQGENLRFKLEYPSVASSDNIITHSNNGASSTTTYFFGSGDARATNIGASSEVEISDVSHLVSYAGYDRGIIRYKFITSGVDFSVLDVGDVIGIGADVGFTNTENTGNYRILGIGTTAGNTYIDVHNPSAIATIVGRKEITHLTLVDEGSVKERTQVICVADIAGSLDGKYFILQDDVGSVAFWIDVDDTGTAEPSHGANRSVKITTVTTGMSATNVANAIYTAVTLDSEFDPVSNATGTFIVESSEYGTRAAASAGDSGFTVSQDTAGADSNMDGEYLSLYDSEGEVCFWINTSGSAAQPSIGANRYVEINTINVGELKETIGGKVSTVINNDSQFSSNASNQYANATDENTGIRIDASWSTGIAAAGASVSVLQQGVNGSTEVVLYPSKINIYPLTKTSVADIVEKVNEGSLIEAVAVGDDSREITKATRDDQYTPAGVNDYSVSLSYGHTPDPGYREITSIKCLGTTTTLNSEYFILPDGPTTTVAFWYNISGSDPEPAHGADRSVEITNVVWGTQYYVAEKTAIAINNDPNFTCVNPDGFSEDTIYVQNVNVGAHTESASGGNSGFTVTQIVAGSDANPAANYVSLYDGINWVKSFQNLDPHFTLKAEMVLQDVCDDSTYSIDNNPNYDSSELGEKFKLVPVTPENVYHHFTQKALSQLPIVADVDYTNMKRKIQVKSQQLGSDGAVEVVGGNANDASFSIFGESQTVSEDGNDFLAVSISTFPNTLTKGDLVELENTQDSPRYSRLDEDDSIDVVPEGGTTNVQYQYNHKDLQLSSNVRFTISDVSVDAAKVQNIATTSEGNVKEQTQIVCAADVAGSLDGKYFILQDNDGKVAFWYDIDNSGTTIPDAIDTTGGNSEGVNRAVEITTVATGDLIGTVGTKTYTAIDTDSKFSGISDDTAGTIVVENTEYGARVLGYNGDASPGFTFSALVEGQDSLLDGNFWTFYSTDNEASFYVWYNSDAGSAVDPAPDGYDYGIEVAVSLGDTADTVASATRLALTNNEYVANYFTISGATNNIILTNLTVGDANDASDGSASTNFAFTITTEGAAHGRNATTVWRWRHSQIGEYVNITDRSVGTVTAPGVVSPTSKIEINDITRGDASTAQNFHLIMSGGTPAQADFYYMTSQSGTVFAVWFDVDGDGTLPTHIDFTSADVKIRVGITSNDFENEIVNKISDALVANTAFNNVFAAAPVAGFSFNNANIGDLLKVYNYNSADFDQSDWNAGNISFDIGDGRVSGWPIVAVNTTNNYVDVVNPFGEAMTDKAVGDGNIATSPSPIIRWNLRHVSKTEISNIDTNTSPDIIVTTTTPHYLKTGDKFTIADNYVDNDGTGYVVTSVSNSVRFHYTDAGAGAPDTYDGGSIIKTETNSVACENTRYKIEPMAYNNLVRISYVSGQAPYFLDLGVAVDDLVVISGSTFLNANRGTFRVLGVDQDYIIIENPNAIAETNTLDYFNNSSSNVTWTNSSDEITGSVGDFQNLAIGNWVKKYEDEESLYVQITDLQNDLGATVSGDAATVVQLADAYRGTSAEAQGVFFDAVTDVDTGVWLRNMDDITIYEGDCVQVGDELFIDNISHDDWFDFTNVGTREINAFGTSDDHKPYISVDNNAGIAETDRLLSVSDSGVIIHEGRNNRFKSIRQIENVVLDETNSSRRTVFLSPSNRSYKYSRTNGTKLSTIGKLGYEVGVVSGIDGYKYYTGLLRTVQRIVDGYEPDPATFPGRRAIGGVVETLPPLINSIVLSIDITTNEGINLNEISANIKSTIIDYVNNLGVGEDVILAEIIVRCMEIVGVEAATMSIPNPSNERIAIADNEKAYVEPGNISIA